jgi:hypothetical protein
MAEWTEMSANGGPLCHFQPIFGSMGFRPNRFRPNEVGLENAKNLASTGFSESKILSWKMKLTLRFLWKLYLVYSNKLSASRVSAKRDWPIPTVTIVMYQNLSAIVVYQNLSIIYWKNDYRSQFLRKLVRLTVHITAILHKIESDFFVWHIEPFVWTSLSVFTHKWGTTHLYYIPFSGLVFAITKHNIFMIISIQIIVMNKPLYGQYK